MSNNPSRVVRLDRHEVHDPREPHERFDHEGNYIPLSECDLYYGAATAFDWMRLVRCNRTPLPPPAAAVLLALVMYTDREGKCFPSVDTLAAVTRLARRTVQRAITKLVSAGMITADKPRGGHRSTVYQIVAHESHLTAIRDAGEEWHRGIWYQDAEGKRYWGAPD